MFYTYLWLREDATPYYVGKGKGNRAWATHKGHRPPTDLTRIIILHQTSERDAFDKEVELIALYGRKDLGTGVLRNHSNGGDNPPNAAGKKRTAEFRAKMRLVAKGRKPSLEACAKGGRTGGHGPLPTRDACARGGRTQGLRNQNSGRRAGQRALETGQILAIRTPESIIKGNRAGLHSRWHINRNITNPACALCTASL